MIVCKEIRKVDGGYIVVLPFPWGAHSNSGEVVVTTFDEVVKLLRDSAHEPDVKAVVKAVGMEVVKLHLCHSGECDRP